MPYSSENMSSVTEAFAAKKMKAERDADARRAEIYEKLPKIREIDKSLSETGLKIFGEALKGKKDLAERIAKLKKETDELAEARRAILKSAGYDVNYTEPKYECEKCSDTGYCKDGKMCSCLSLALTKAGFESSGMAKLIKKQTFDNFSLDYYSGSDKAQMEKNLSRAREFAAAVSRGEYRDMLFMGTTGLGKTHLSSAVAKTAIEGGCDVVYESAQNVFSDFEYERFSRSYGDSTPPKTKKYFDCDLLIIDDLGTEISNQFTVSCLYNLINSRIVAEKSMLISTNVGKEEMLERYSDRILSRLFGEFEVCIFSGKDVRSQKLKKK